MREKGIGQHRGRGGEDGDPRRVGVERILKWNSFLLKTVGVHVKLGKRVTGKEIKGETWGREKSATRAWGIKKKKKAREKIREAIREGGEEAGRY